MSQLAQDGFGVLFISSELKEVMAMADRILVMSSGAITGDFLAKMRPRTLGECFGCWPWCR